MDWGDNENIRRVSKMGGGEIETFWTAAPHGYVDDIVVDACNGYWLVGESSDHYGILDKYEIFVRGK